MKRYHHTNGTISLHSYLGRVPFHRVSGTTYAWPGGLSPLSPIDDRPYKDLAIVGSCEHGHLLVAALVHFVTDQHAHLHQEPEHDPL